MYRIMIADDEQIERQAFRLLVRKHFPDLEILPDAATGNDVIEMVRRNRPDIIFLDIQMPMRTGLEALEQISDLSGKIKIIILSAHDKFEFAQKAMKYGANEYLLKPVSREDMIRIIDYYIRELDAERGFLVQQERISKQINIISPHIEHEIVMHVVYGDKTLAELSDYMQILEIFTDNMAVVLVQPSQYDDVFESTVMNAAKEISCCVVSGVLREYVLILLPIAENMDAVQKAEWIRDFVAYLAERLKRGGMQAKIGMGEDFQTTGEIHVCYHQARMALAEAKTINDYRHSEQSQRSENAEQIVQHVLDGSGTEDMIQDFLTGTLLHCHESVEALKLELERMIASIGAALDNEYQRYQNYLLGQKVQRCDVMEELRNMMGAYLLQVNKLKSADSSRTSAQLAKAIDFIQSHYEKEIMLADIAEHVQLSTYYLSKLFKNHLNKNFTDYLAEIRIQKAKTLLMGTDKSIKEIAYEVGYKNPAYFCQVFKKIVGESAGQFRKKAVWG